MMPLSGGAGSEAKFYCPLDTSFGVVKIAVVLVLPGR